MRILALDVGSKLGWATDSTGRLEWGTEDFHIRNGESSGNRWRRFGEWLDEMAGRAPVVTCPEGAKQEDVEQVAAQLRAGHMRSEVLLPQGFTAIFMPKIDLIVYERAHFMPKARAAAEIAAGFTTRLEEHCERHGIALEPVGVSTLKAFAVLMPKLPPRKKGDPPRKPRHATKEQMIAAAEARLLRGGIAIGKATYAMKAGTVVTAGALEVAHLTEHEADALWLYFMAKERYG